MFESDISMIDLFVIPCLDGIQTILTKTEYYVKMDGTNIMSRIFGRKKK
jgi:hypothetical protein